MLKAIHEIDDKYIAESLLSSDLKECYGKEFPISEKESIERIKELTYKKIRALEKQNEWYSFSKYLNWFAEHINAFLYEENELT